MNEFYLGSLNLSEIVLVSTYTAHLRLDVQLNPPDTQLWESLKDLSLEADGRLRYRDAQNPRNPPIGHGLIPLYIQHNRRVFAGLVAYDYFRPTLLRIQLKTGEFAGNLVEAPFLSETLYFNPAVPYTSKEGMQWKA